MLKRVLLRENFASLRSGFDITVVQEVAFLRASVVTIQQSSRSQESATRVACRVPRVQQKKR